MGSNTTSYDYIVAADSPFKATDAYKNENVMLLDGDLATRPGPRLIDALELVAKLLHPEIFN
jgi:iron complex transport system substrate-binding protein